MLYYRVKSKYDQAYHAKLGALIAGELFTPYEIKIYAVPRVAVEQINTSKLKTYFMFGCRRMLGKG